MLWTCLACTARYAPGLARCPHCGSPDHLEDGMPKIHADGSVTDAARDAELEAAADEPDIDDVDERADEDEKPKPAPRRARTRAGNPTTGKS